MNINMLVAWLKVLIGNCTNLKYIMRYRTVSQSNDLRSGTE